MKKATTLAAYVLPVQRAWCSYPCATGSGTPKGVPPRESMILPVRRDAQGRPATGERAVEHDPPRPWRAGLVPRSVRGARIRPRRAQGPMGSRMLHMRIM